METLNYASAAQPTFLTAPLGTTGNPVVNDPLVGWSTNYPTKMLIDWGLFGLGQTQEAMYVTGPPTGTPGNYTVPVIRGADNTGPSLGTGTSHIAAAVVVHGATGEDYLLNPFGQQALATQRSQALTPWYAALANRQFARCDIVCLGDSITEGQAASAWDNAWRSRLRDMLRARYPTPGLTGGGRGFIGAVNSGESSFGWPAVVAGGGTATGDNEGPKGHWLQFNGSGQTLTYSLTGDTADIFWIKQFLGGTFSWAVDGGSATNISTGGGGLFDGQVTHITLGAAGPHSLVLTRVSGTSNIAGVVEYNGDFGLGIAVHDCGHFGWLTGNWVTATGSGAAGSAAAIAALSPNVVVITLGANDQFSNVAPSTYQSNLQTIITNLKSRLTAPYPAFVLNMLPGRGNQNTFTYPWAQYVNAAYAVAAADTSGPLGNSIVTVMDFTLGPRMPGFDTDVYGLWAGTVHPSNTGHQLIADSLLQFLSQP